MQPVLFDFGFISIRYYGLFYGIAVYLAIKLVQKDSKRLKLPLTDDEIVKYSVISFIICVLGARAYFLLFNLDWYFGSNVVWYEFLAIWNGGLALHGAFIAIIFIVIYHYYFSAKLSSKDGRLALFVYADAAAAPIFILQALGRLGNFMNGEGHGVPTDLPWGVIFKYGMASSQFPGIPVHPTMLYEAGLDIIGFLILWRLRLKNFKAGFIVSLYLIFYALIRLSITGIRADESYIFGIMKDGSTNWMFEVNDFLDYGVSAPVVASIVSILVGFALILYFKLYQKRDYLIYK